MSKFMGMNGDMSWAMVIVVVVMFVAVATAAALDLPVAMEEA